MAGAMRANVERAAHNDAIILAALERAANAGQPCPSNGELASLIDRQSTSAAVEALARLSRAGRIAVQRGPASRVVTILATGKSTAGTITQTHWRDRPENAHRKRIRYRKAKPRPAPPPPPAASPRIERTCCPWCGVRSDVGCRHSMEARA